MGGSCGTHGRDEKMYNILVGKRRDRNIKTDRTALGCEVVDRDRDQWRSLVNTVMNLRIPQNEESFLTS
jgi:hypothetical protein